MPSQISAGPYGKGKCYFMSIRSEVHDLLLALKV